MGWPSNYPSFKDMQSRISNPLDLIEIKKPPCTECKFWKPQIMCFASKPQDVDGARLCHAPEQFHDFSCYEPGVDDPKARK